MLHRKEKKKDGHVLSISASVPAHTKLYLAHAGDTSIEV